MKKTINNTLKSLFTAAVILFAFTACQELNIDSQDPAPTSVLVDGLDEYTVLAGSPSNIIFNISANTPWTITSDQQWCTPTPAMSAASSLVAEITLVTEPNETISDRTATLSITSEELGLIKEIKVKQVSKEKLIVIPYDEMVSSEGGDISFTIASNKPWEIIPSTQFLENIDKSSGEGTLNADKEIITLTIPANTAARRSGTLTVKTAFEEYTFEIKQDGIVFELEDPSESGSIDFGGLETEKTVKIVSNADWKAEVNKEFQDWISVEKVADDELKIKLIQRNNIFKTREGAITLKTTKLIPGFEGVEFPIKQATPFVFNGSSEEIIINEDTGSAKVVKNGNAIWSDYAFTTGHISFEFEEISVKDDTGRLVLNMYPDVGNTNFHIWLDTTQPSCMTCGGGFEWEEVLFDLSAEEINAIKKLDVYVEEDPDHSGNLRIRIVIDGKEMGTLVNKDNVYVNNPEQNPGQIIYLGLFDKADSDYFIIKSLTYTAY